jgi:hypothetical protein
MHQIELSYPKGKPFAFTAPSIWNELTRQQLLHWSAICLKKIPLCLALNEALKGFFGLPGKLFDQLNRGQLLQLADTLSWLKEDSQLKNWLIPSIRQSLTRYYGPKDYLNNLTIAEYRRTELYYHTYARTGSKRWLLLLVATLYRKKRSTPIDDDIREELTEQGVQQRAGRFYSLSAPLLQAVLLNYEGCRNQLMWQYARAFKRGLPELYRDETPDLEEVIEALAGDKFGTFVQTEQTNLHRFFRYLVNTIKRSEEEKTNLK